MPLPSPDSKLLTEYTIYFTAITNCHKLSGLKQHFFFLYSGRIQASRLRHKQLSEGVSRTVLPWVAPGENRFPVAPSGL